LAKRLPYFMDKIGSLSKGGYKVERSRLLIGGKKKGRINKGTAQQCAQTRNAVAKKQFGKRNKWVGWNMWIDRAYHGDDVPGANDALNLGLGFARQVDIYTKNFYTLLLQVGEPLLN